MTNRKYHLESERRIFYSQNFLKNPEVAWKILEEKCSLSPEDTVYEIGAGKGAITEILAKRCQRVVAIEIDPNLYCFLKKKFAQTPNVEIIQGDFLKQPLPRFPYKVFANPPFRIFSEIIRKLTETENPPEATYLFAQKEAAQKFTGKPETTLMKQLTFF